MLNHEFLKRWLAAFALFVISGCAATVPLTPEPLDIKGKRFTPPFDKANLYVIRSGSLMARGVLFQVIVDGKVQGAMAQGTYFLLNLTPGSHIVSAVTEESSDSIKINTTAGKNYFLRIKPELGLASTSIALEKLDSEKGKTMVRETRRAQHFTTD